MHIAYNYHDQGTMADVYSVQLPGYNVPGFAVETSENSFPLASLYKTLNIHTYIRMYALCTCVHTCMCTYVHTYVCMYVHMCTAGYMLTYSYHH